MADITKVADLPRILRSRAETGIAHHGEAWSQGVRFAANQLESALSQQPSAAGVPKGYVLVPAALAERVQDSLGRFTSDDGFAQADVDTSDDFAACVAAIQPVGQEPVAWYYGFGDTGEAGPVTFGGNPGAEAIEWAERHGHTLHYLYAAPPAQVDIEAALDAADPDWRNLCRPNLRGSERLFFAIYDIAEYRRMLAGEKPPVPGNGLTVVRTGPSQRQVPHIDEVLLNGNKPMSLAVALDFADNPRPYHSLMCPADTNGELYRALRVLASVYREAAPPAQAVDLEQFRDAVVTARDVYQQDADNWRGRKREAIYLEYVAECDRLLALIDQQAGGAK